MRGFLRTRSNPEALREGLFFVGRDLRFLASIPHIPNKAAEFLL